MATVRTVGEFMTKSPIVVEKTTSMGQALRIMKEQGFRHLPVVTNGHLMGVVSERELRIVENMRGIDHALAIVGDFILGEPYKVEPSAPLREVARTMAENKYGSVVVCEGEAVVGVFTTTDALRALASLLA